MQKKGAGFHEASSCYWDSANDRTSLSLSLSPSLLLCRTVDVAHGRAPLVAPCSELFVPLGEQVHALHHVRVRHQPLRWQPRTGELNRVRCAFYYFVIVYLYLYFILFFYFIA